MTTTIGSLDLNAFNDLYSDSNQYFWFEGNGSATYGAGAHVTLVPDTTFISNPTGQNILMNTDGFSIRNGLLPMMTLDNDSLDFNVVDTTAGTYTITATFTATGAQIGQSNKTHVNVYSNSLELTDSAGTTFFKVRDAVNESGEVTNTFVGDGNTTQFTLSYTASNTTYTVTQNGTTVSPTKTTTQITFSIAPAVGDIIVVVYNIVGNSAKAYDLGIRKTNTISGSYSVIEGYATTASGVSSHAEGRNTTASGSYSHAEGYLTTASGYYSHAEGDGTTANGSASHAEGYVTTASGKFSHSEGINTSASGYASHAEGRDTTASEYYSHAAGWGTIAVGVGQTAIGKYNIQDPDVQTSKEKAFIIGNGSSSVRSNAFTVDWNGNVVASGNVTDGNGNTLSNPNGFFVREPYSINHSITAGSSSQITKDITKAGYYPLGIVGYDIAGTASTWLMPFKLSLSSVTTGSATIYCNLRNLNSGSGSSSGTMSVVVLWCKST